MQTDPRKALQLEQFELPKGWSWRWLDEVMDIRGGAQPPANTFVDAPGPGYVRFVQIRDFDGDSHTTFIEDSPKWRKCSSSDVLIARYGVSLGRILRGLKGAYNVALVKAIPKGLNLDFLYYLLKSEFFQAPLAGLGARSVQSGFNKADLRTIPVPVPPIGEQKAIAQSLEALDAKIELNCRMNDTLEAMARAIFKSWFVDFDPVRAKAAGPRPFGMDAETAALFPNSFEDSPLGKIPKGWHVGKILDLMALSRDSITPGAFPDELFDHYSIPAFDEGRWPKTEGGAEIKSNKFSVPRGVVLLSKLNPRIRRIWLPFTIEGRRSIASTEFLVVLPKTQYTREFLYFLLSAESFVDVFATLVTGTSGSHQRVKAEFFLNMQVVTPSNELVLAFTSRVKPMCVLIAKHLEQSQTLAALRDLLLPQLISGEIRIKDAEKMVGEKV